MVTKSPAIISLEDFTESINMVVYADSGTGKTVFGGGAKSLFLATESGTISAKRQGSTASLWKIGSWAELQEAYDWLVDNEDHGYDWIVIDSVTNMQKLCMRAILDQAVTDSKGARDPDIPALQDWQKYYNMFQRFIVAFNDLPTNVLYTATTMRSEDEEGEALVLPDIQGKGYSISQALCASVGVVAYMKKSSVGKGDDAETRRQLLFEAMPPYFAKDRYNVFPRWLTLTQGDKQVNTLASITDMIMGTAPGKKAPVAAPARKVAPTRRPLRAAK